MVRFSYRPTKDATTKTVLDLDIDIQDLADYEGAEQATADMEYGAKVRWAAYGRKHGLKKLTEYLDKKGITYTVTEDVPVAQASEDERLAKAFIKKFGRDKLKELLATQ